MLDCLVILLLSNVFFDQKNENVRLLDDSVLTELAKRSAK